MTSPPYSGVDVALVDPGASVEGASGARQGVE
jgi:hypothetical protein